MYRQIVMFLTFSFWINFSFADNENFYSSDFIDVSQFGAKGDGLTNDTEAFQKAIGTGRAVYVPKGIYLVNLSINVKAIIFGDGSTSSLLRAYDKKRAIITYKSGAPYWTYHSEVRNVSLQSSNKSGVGFAFGQTNVSDYQNGDEYATNVTFRNVDFRGFEKAVQFTYGNIGTEFYSCGFHSNKYAAYALNNKWYTRGGVMQAGNKYFYGGEFSDNDCGVYVHNTQDGFGAINFRDVIFQSNAINAYFFVTRCFVPILFDGCWNEETGDNYKKVKEVSLDYWDGQSKKSVSVKASSFIFDGSGGYFLFKNSRVSNIVVKGKSIKVRGENCATEQYEGVGGSLSKVEDETSSIVFSNSYTSGGVPLGRNILVEDCWYYNDFAEVGPNSFTAGARVALIPPRFIKQKLDQAISGCAIPLLTAAKFVGSLNTVPGRVVDDGVIFSKCNEWTIPFTARNQYMTLEGSSINPIKGYYVATIDLKIREGNPVIWIWNKHDHMAIFKPADFGLNDGKWFTLASYGYFSTAKSNIALEIGETVKRVVLRASAWQFHWFSSEMEAQQFLKSKVYLNQ